MESMLTTQRQQAQQQHCMSSLHADSTACEQTACLMVCSAASLVANRALSETRLLPLRLLLLL
jgi:hypothetical protein